MVVFRRSGDHKGPCPCVTVGAFGGRVPGRRAKHLPWVGCRAGSSQPDLPELPDVRRRELHAELCDPGSVAGGYGCGWGSQADRRCEDRRPVFRGVVS